MRERRVLENSKFEYIRPESLVQAVSMLNDPVICSKILAGGTNLMVDLRCQEPDFQRVVDISRLPELKVIEKLDTTIILGAGTTFREIIASKLIYDEVPFLVQACKTVGTPQIKNLGTIGGNVANASSCADTTPVLLCLDSIVHICSETNKREIPLSVLLSSKDEINLFSNEVITHFSFQIPPYGTKTLFLKLARAAQAISRITIAAMIRIDPIGIIDTARITIGASTLQPLRLPQVETFLVGSALSKERIMQAGELAVKEVFCDKHQRWSSEFKQKAIVAMLEQVLHQLS